MVIDRDENNKIINIFIEGCLKGSYINIFKDRLGRIYINSKDEQNRITSLVVKISELNKIIKIKKSEWFPY